MQSTNSTSTPGMRKIGGMTPAEYEELIAEIVRAMRGADSALDSAEIHWGGANRIAGKSGYGHQIDVSVETRDRLFIIECKRWEKRICVAEVLALAARTANILKCREPMKVFPILVSARGVTRGAKQLAEYFGIQLELTKSANEFGMRLGDIVRQGVADKALFRDEAKATVHLAQETGPGDPTAPL